MVRAVTALALVGLMLMATTFGSIADGKFRVAAESGLGGGVLLATSWFLAKRTILRVPGRRRRRTQWITRDERSALPLGTRTPPACVACRKEVVIGSACEECGAAVHVDCVKRHVTETHQLSAGAYR